MKKIVLFSLLILCNLILKSQMWQQSTGIPSNEFIYDIASYDNYVFAATLSGIYRSSDNGQTFEPKNNGIINTSGLGAHAFSKSGNKIYVANIYGIFVTEDFGENWVDLNLPSHTYSLSVFADDNIILAGVPGGGLYRSTDNGVIWEGVTADHIYKIAKVNNYYFAGSWGDVVYSNDFGINWQSADLNNFTFWTFSMNDTIFACPTDGGILKTSPENINWQTVDGISSNVTGISIKNDTIFAVATDKILYSKYNKINNTWKELTITGLPVLENNVLTSSSICNNYLVVGSSGNDGETGLGVWYIDLNEIFTSIKYALNDNKIEIYPNPANNTIFVNNIDEICQIQIFDLTGKIQIEIKNSNNRIDISSLSNGIYLLKIENSSEIFLNKFIKK